jgi:O-antigen/teichoic acid export membrane protein
VGRGFSASVDALRWLCLIPLFRSFHLSAGDAITGAGFQGYRTVYQFIATAANFAMNAYLIPRYSWQGAAWASLVTDGGLGAASWITLRILSRRQCADRRLIEPAC